MNAEPHVHEALIYLMVVTSASDRDMSDPELGLIGEVVRSWPIFEDFDSDRLIEVAQDCQLLLHEKDGLEGVLARARLIPERLHDTAYAAAFEVTAVDLEMRMEEARILQRLGVRWISTTRRSARSGGGQGAAPHATR